MHLLPLDEPRLLEGHLALAFLAYAAVKPDIAAGLRGQTTEMRAFIADQLRASGVSADPEVAATTLLALVEGLGLHLMGQNYSPEVALTAFDAHLDALFGPD